MSQKPSTDHPSGATDHHNGDNIPDDIAAMAFEDALGALEDIVKNLESGQVSLEESIATYSRGTQLRRHCDNKLKEASMRIEKITRLTDGTLTTTELDAG